MTPEIRHIRSLLSVARLGSFTRASIELHISRSALTVQIQQLESALGVTLLHRSKRKAALTQAGIDLIVPFERVLTDIESIMNRGQDLAGLHRGLVTVVVAPSLAETLLPRALNVFCQAYPGISLRLNDTAGKFVEAVKNDEVDFGIGAVSQKDRSVVTQPLFTEPICAFALMNHPVAAKRIITLGELVKHTLILPQKYSNLRLIFDRALAEQRLHVGTIHESSHMSSTISMVNAGIGIAILSRCAMECFHSTNIHCIRIKPALKREVVIASRAGHSFSPAAAKLIDIVQDISRSSRWAAT